MRYFFVYLLLSFSLVASGQDRSETADEIEKLLLKNPAFDLHTKKGIIIATITGEQINYFSFGASNPNKNSIFEIGDVSKALTGTLVHILNQTGLFSIDRGVNELLPPSYRNSVFDDLVVQDLLSHTSGMPRIPDNFGINQLDGNQPFKHYQKEQFAEFVNGLSQKKQTKRYSYSHVNFELIKIILEHQTGMSFNDLLQIHLCNPLGLRNTSASGNKIQPIAGYNKIGRKVEPQEFSSFEAAKGIKSTASDLALIVSQMMSDDHKFSIGFHSAITPTNPTIIDRSTSIASGWHTIQLKRYYEMVVHKGNTSGHSSIVTFVPGTKTGVVVLSCTELNIAPLGYQILEFLNDNWKRKKLLK